MHFYRDIVEMFLDVTIQQFNQTMFTITFILVSGCKSQDVHESLSYVKAKIVMILNLQNLFQFITKTDMLT